MKEKPIFPLLLSMSLPMVISMAVNSLYNIVDSYFVAKISEDAMTALSLVFPIQNFINAVAIGFGVGINAMIAQYLGAGRRDKADEALTQGMVLAVIHGIVMMILCIIGIPYFLRLFTTDANVIALGVRYATIVFSFSVILSVNLTFEKMNQAIGNMKITMISLLIGCGLNIILDPMIIFGIGPFPELGIAGAALATGFGQCVPIVIYIAAYLKRPKRVAFRREYLHLTREVTKRLYSIGVPAILNMALTSVLTTALNAILAAFSQTYVLVLGIYYKLQTFLYMPANGIIQGMRPLIGYNYGAGEHKRVEKLYRLTLLLNICIMTAGMILCLTIPGKLMGAFAENPQTIQNGVTALHIICFGFILSAVSVTACGALEGLGKGIPSLLISLSRYVVLIIPLALIFSRFFGAAGVWHAFWVTEALSAVFAVIIYRRSVKAESFIEAE
ncbi:MATE efflux family protein [Eubacterium ramulus ATCC 29099]|uniref:Probable multidrug resistance protein NorM n=2 Tax=Eubacterium ramulus TaxID=39490 RepID=U2NW39_EUBRA|nr:MATE efflux family protein [Eubacterium ramulus ATCC 29099]